MACLPKHDLTVCPLQSLIPPQEKTKQTGGGVLLTDSKSPWIKSINSLTSERERIYAVDSSPNTLPAGEDMVQNADVTAQSIDTNLIGYRAERS